MREGTNMACGWKMLLRPLSLTLLFCIGLSWMTSRRVNAQFFSQGEQSSGSQLSSDRVRDRMSRQKKGANIQEWVRRLKNDRPETRLEAVKSLGDSKDPKAIEHLMNATAVVDIRVKVKAIHYLVNLKAT